MRKEKPFNEEDYGGRKTIIVLCIDTSNSMYSWQKEINRAVRSFVEALDNEPKSRYGTEIAIVTYDTHPKLHVNFTTEKNKLPPITIPAKNPNGGWTDTGDALTYAVNISIDEWRRLKTQDVKVYLPWVILFTDGKPENKERDALQKMETAIKHLQSWETPQQKTDKIHFIGIGVGENVDVSLMRRISAHGSCRYRHANNFSDLSTLFKHIGATTISYQPYDYEDIDASFQRIKPTNDVVNYSADSPLGFSIESPVNVSILSSDELSESNNVSLHTNRQNAESFLDLTSDSEYHPEETTFSSQSWISGIQPQEEEDEIARIMREIEQDSANGASWQN